MGSGSGDRLPECDGCSTREGDAAKRRSSIVFYHTSLGRSGPCRTVQAGELVVAVPPCAADVLGVSLGGLKAENAESADWDDCLTRV